MPRSKSEKEGRQKASAAVLKVTTFKTLFCPLFEHQKSTEVCTVLRAKRVCRHQCAKYFEWAKANPEVVHATLSRYETNVREYLKKHGVEKKNLLENVLPAGDHICAHCGKAFIHEGRLKAHQKKKHRRLL